MAAEKYTIDVAHTIAGFEAVGHKLADMQATLDTLAKNHK